MESASNDFLATERIDRLMLRYGLPCVVSLLVGALYNVVDQIFIGQGVGYIGNGATNVVFPLTVLALAVATMIGDGACAFVSLSLGRRDTKSAGSSVGNAVVLTLAASLVLTAAFLIFSDPLLWLFGATPANIGYAREYFFYITLGIPFYMFTNTMNPIIRADGSPRFAMVTTLVGAVINVIFDPVAIFLLGWGVMGAAVVTVLGQFVSALLSLVYLCRLKAIRLEKTSWKPDPGIIGKILPLGFCSFLSQLSVVISMGATSNMLVRYGMQSVYGADIPLTVVGIVCKYFQIVISVVIGLAAGCIPLVGYNIGAGLKLRARSVLVRLMAYEAGLGLIALAVFQLFPRELISLFGNENALYNEFAIRTFRIYLSMMVLACVNKASFIFLQSMGRPWLSTFLSLLREVILSVPLAVILPHFFGLDGVLYSMPLSDIIAFAASAAVLVSIYRELSGDTKSPGMQKTRRLALRENETAK